MGEAFRIGGWGMYPTTVFGLVLIAAAAASARRCSPRSLRVVSNLRMLVLLSSVLGFVTGVIKTFTSLPPGKLDDVGAMALEGVGESLANVGLGLVVLVIATIITTLGAARSGDSPDLVDPRGG